MASGMDPFKEEKSGEISSGGVSNGSLELSGSCDKYDLGIADARGHSSFYAALDTEIRINKHRQHDIKVTRG